MRSPHHVFDLSKEGMTSGEYSVNKNKPSHKGKCWQLQSEFVGEWDSSDQRLGSVYPHASTRGALRWYFQDADLTIDPSAPFGKQRSPRYWSKSGAVQGAKEILVGWSAPEMMRIPTPFGTQLGIALRRQFLLLSSCVRLNKIRAMAGTS